MTVYAEYIGTAILSGLWITPLSILWFVSLCLARRKNDPARVGIAWMKAVFPFWVLGLVCLTIRSGLLVWLAFDDDSYYNLSASAIIAVEKIIAHLDAVGTFFENVADILLFITFVELAGGFLLCVTGQPSSVRKFGRFAILGWSVVLFALAVAYFGLLNSYAVRFITLSSQANQRASELQAVLTMNRMVGAIKILYWLTSIPMLALASFVVHKTKTHELLRGVARLFLVATILDFIRLTVVMAIYVHVFLANKDVENIVLSVVEPIFNHIFMFVVLVLLFSLAIRKTKGLWSQPQGQHGWNYPSVAYMPTAQVGGLPPPMPYHGAEAKPPQQGLPAYLQVAQQQQQAQQHQQFQQQYQQQYQQQQGQQMAPSQGQYYYPQPTHQQPMPAYQQGHQPGAEPVRVAN